MTEAFEASVESWLTDKPSKLQRIKRGALALWYTRIYRPFRIWGATHWASKTCMASSAPVIAWYFYGSITGWIATLASVGIFAGHSVVSILDQASRRKSSGTNPVTEVATRFGEIVQSFPKGGEHHLHRDDNIRSALGILESVARAVTGANPGEISVCLATYEGSHTERMRLRHRNPGSTRPTNKTFQGTETVAHFACKSGPDPRVVHDLQREFPTAGRRSPTQSNPNYRSIFIIPVERERAGEKRVCGFISIDSVKPYAFYGNKANSIIVVCEPITNHIQDLLEGGE